MNRWKKITRNILITALHVPNGFCQFCIVLKKILFILPIIFRFHINLQCGPGEAAPRPNVAFHFNPRFAAQKIVRNALADQKWGNEEKETPSFPFVPGGYFEVGHPNHPGQGNSFLWPTHWK